MKELEQEIEIRHHEADVGAKYRHETNQSVIRVHRSAPDCQETRPGVVYLNLTTSAGELSFGF